MSQIIDNIATMRTKREQRCCIYVTGVAPMPLPLGGCGYTCMYNATDEIIAW
tara:strand:- start:230 stop:385 length:156 start_codon:yes stop_codon:yes gene_type:complete